MKNWKGPAGDNLGRRKWDEEHKYWTLYEIRKCTAHSYELWSLIWAAYLSLKAWSWWDIDCDACRVLFSLISVGSEGICHLAWTYAQRGNISYLLPCECQLWSITMQFPRCVLEQISVLSQYCSPRGRVSSMTSVPLPILEAYLNQYRSITAVTALRVLWLGGSVCVSGDWVFAL